MTCILVILFWIVCAGVAQLVEHSLGKGKADGS